MKRSIIFATLAIILLLICLFAVLAFNDVQKPFYVGVTFGGNNISDAKLLIDKVKDYTNIFVLQSGSLQTNLTKLEDICDYAVESGLDIMVYFGSYGSQQNTTSAFIETAQERWGNHFLGVYYGDEPGGKMLDANSVILNDPNTGDTITKYANGAIMITKTDGTLIDYTEFGYIFINAPDRTGIVYQPNGAISVTTPNGTNFTYEPNGTIIMQDPSGKLTIVEDNTNLPQVEPYETVLNARPFQTYDETAERFTKHIESTIEWMSNKSITVLTSDYGLYWFDYLGGYDVVLAQVGWNHTTAQDIALVRGAANLQDKDWGAILTWKYTDWPYLADGDEIFDQMRTAYECGAEYAILFNYAEEGRGPNGTLQPEHFQALQRFWNEVVQNPAVAHGNVKADSVLVLHINYGWGMRRPDDKIWGLWNADDKSPQVWTQLQNALEAHGLRLDIVYDDPAYPVTGKYGQIYYWNQTD